MEEVDHRRAKSLKAERINTSVLFFANKETFIIYFINLKEKNPLQ